nr:response regulator transcription factor [Methylobacter psychrophilus]
MVVDDHDIIRLAVKYLVNETDYLQVVAETGEGGEALALCRKHSPDLLVLGIMLNNRDGLDILIQVKKEFPNLPVLILTAHDENTYGIRSFQAGASGYLNKRFAGAQLLTAIDCILTGNKYITPSMTQILASWVQTGMQENAHEALSAREFQTIQLIASGMSVGDIAEKLHLSVKTISMYRARILQKLVLRNNAELMRYVFDNNLVLDRRE